MMDTDSQLAAREAEVQVLREKVNNLEFELENYKEHYEWWKEMCLKMTDIACKLAPYYDKNN